MAMINEIYIHFEQNIQVENCINLGAFENTRILYLSTSCAYALCFMQLQIIIKVFQQEFINMKMYFE